MSTVNESFKQICKTVLEKGETYTNARRGVTRLQIPSYTFEHDMTKGFPLIGIKNCNYRTIAGELIWFLRGSGKTHFLKRNNIKIWDADEKNFFNKTGIKNDTGQSYPVQWRNYNGKTDQIANLIKNMKKDIMGSRLIVNAWNPSEIHNTALPPCHTGFQIIGVPNKGFELHWSQRSCDLFLGIPFNIASYATLGVYLEKITGHKFTKLVGDLKAVHFYDNQLESAKKLIKRDISSLKECSLEVLKVTEDFSQLEIKDFKINNYNSLEKINVKMLAPISI